MADPLPANFDQMTATIARAVNTVIDTNYPGLNHAEKMRLLVLACAHECGLVIATIAANEDLELPVVADIAGTAAVRIGKAARVRRLPNAPSTFDFRDQLSTKP